MNRFARRFAIFAVTVVLTTLGAELPGNAVGAPAVLPAGLPATCTGTFIYPLQTTPTCNFRYTGGPLEASLEVVATGTLPIGAWTIAVDIRQLGASQDPGCAAGGNKVAIFGRCSGRNVPTVALGTRLTCRVIFLETLAAVGTYRCGVAVV